MSPHIECPMCHAVSFNSNDIENRYCGNCRVFHEEITLPRMSLAQQLASISDPYERACMLGRLEGMQIAMRVCRNRSEDLRGAGRANPTGGTEADVCGALIRHIQVEFASGRFPFPELTREEVAEIERIWL